MNYLNIKEASAKWNISERCIQKYCTSGKIPGARNLGRQWLIPGDAHPPVDGRTRIAKNGLNKEFYHFPALIFTTHCNYLDRLSETERKLLDAQILLLKEDQAECIRQCTELLNQPVPTHVIMGLWFAIGLASVPLGNYTEYKRAVYAMDLIMESETAHKEDYRLLRNYVRFQPECSNVLAEEIDVSKLSYDALPFYQFFLLFSASFTDLNMNVIRLSDTLCRQMQADGLSALEALMHFTIGAQYLRLSDLPRSEKHIEAGCIIAKEADWERVIGKFGYVAQAPLQKCLGKSEFEKYLKITAAGVSGWSLISRLEAGTFLSDVDNPEQLSVMYQICYGRSTETICSIMQISKKEFQSALRECYRITGTKSRRELKNHLKTTFSSLLPEDMA